MEDFKKVESIKYKWYASWTKDVNDYYAKVTKYLGLIDGKPKYNSLLLHRFIVSAKKNDTVDHINHNTLDNRKSNLRVTNISDNLRHRKGKNSNNKSGYRNVCWITSKGQWCVQLMVKGENTRLGYFDDVHEAGKFAEEMREKYYGEFKGLS